MMTLKPQTALGGFALVTLMLAGAAIGRVLGVSFGEALYLTVTLLVMVGWLGNRVTLRCCTATSEDKDREL